MIILAELEAARLFFDETYYVSANTDVREAIAGGAFSMGWQHFTAFGAAEGRNPSAGFDTAYYLSENQDVAAALASEAISSAFAHYIVFGREEGRAPVDPLTGLIQGITLTPRVEADLVASKSATELFDESYYLANNADVAAALAGGTFNSGREHFILYGAAEGRNPSESFDTIYYLEQNSDVAAALVSGAIASAFGHYLRSGRSEGRLSNRPSSNLLLSSDRLVSDVTGEEAIVSDRQANSINSQTQQVEQTTVATVNWPQLVSAALVSPLNLTDSSDRDSNDSSSNNNTAIDSTSETDNTGSSASSSNNSSTDNSSSNSSTDNSSTDNSSSSNNSSSNNSDSNNSSSNNSSSNNSGSNNSSSNNSVTNPGILEFSSDNFSVNEGDGTATIAISRTGGSDREVTVDYAIARGGTATSETDYNIASGTLTFADGASNASFAIAVVDDTNFEGDETVNLVLSNAAGGATLGTVTSSTLTIVDNDAANPGSLQFNSANFSVNEGDGTATIAISRTGGSDGEVTVDYITGSGTATAGTDYTTASGTLTFGDGETSKSFSIPIADDTDTESHETVEITLSNAVGGSLGSQNMTTLTILDDDPLGGLPAAIDSTFVGFSPGNSEAAIAATSAQRLTIGTQNIYIGTHQISSNNQNPIIASFDSANPANNWVRTDYETTGADGRGFGLFWDGTNLYGVFSIDGTQGSSSEDFRRATIGATQNWLKSYGSGGGAKVSVLARINPATGEMTEAAYLSALLSSGNSNTLTVTDISTNASGNLVVQARSFFSPRNPDGSRMTQVGSGSSPFDYTVEITPDLKTVVSTSAVGWE